MEEFSLPDGKVLALVQHQIKSTYSNFLEGTKERASREIRNDIMYFARQMISRCEPLSVIWPEKYVLPQWIHLGEFVFNIPDTTEKNDPTNRRFVCWFSEDYEIDLNEKKAAFVQKVNWKRL